MSNIALGRKNSSGASNAQSTNSSRNEAGGLEPKTLDRQALYCLAIWRSSGFSHASDVGHCANAGLGLAETPLAPGPVPAHRRNPSFCCHKLPIFTLPAPRLDA